MDERLAELRRRLGEVSDLRSALALLDWDQMVMMPPAGAAVRADRQATLERVAHERFVDDRIGELVDELRELEQELLAGTLSTADLPEAWNTRFEEYLGLAVPEDRLGVLQDVHWSCGSSATSRPTSSAT